ncbi:MAG: hypothetical protein LAP61_28005 [Acidobacteriia bacterium]|nr:hypothetical protein [Terriglobia bacterium]
MRSISFLGLLALAGAALHGQPTTGAQYWSTTPPDCSALQENPVVITNSAGTTIGYSCYVTGTFVWLAAGGTWGTSIRVSAPASGAIGVDYSFYDPTGNNLSLDTSTGASLFPASGSDVNFALNANQPSEVRLLGAPSEATQHYPTTQTGSVYAIIYCPNAMTCETVLPQLLYSFLPIQPWSLSVPISWDFFYSPVQPQGAWPQWSATGINDATHFVSLVIYNQDTLATSYTVRVYDSAGNLAGTGTTPSVAPLPVFSDGSFGEGGTYGALLSKIVTTPLPSGVIKVLVDGGSNYSAVAALQFSGPSATSLQVAYDSAPSTSSATTSTMRANVKHQRVSSTPKRVFQTLPR